MSIRYRLHIIVQNEMGDVIRSLDEEYEPTDGMAYRPIHWPDVVRGFFDLYSGHDSDRLPTAPQQEAGER